MPEQTYTLAEVREMQRKAFTRGAFWAEDNYQFPAKPDDDARVLYPDPEPPEPERPTVEYGGIRYRLADNGVTFDYLDGGAGVWRSTGVGAKYILALASLLPRVPVTVTEEMVDAVVQEFVQRGVGVFTPGRPMASNLTAQVRNIAGPIIRAALSAVAADLAQPVHACQHKATRWIGMDARGCNFAVDQIHSYTHDRDRLQRFANELDRDYPAHAPHRVVGLAEVE